MSSTTTGKKEIVDYLWEWAESHEDWAKLLVHHVVKREDALVVPERQSIFEHFIDSLRSAPARKMPPIQAVKPSYHPTGKVIELVSMKNITGVNRLAKNQELKFSQHLTVIYGENGTGKTGYGRILKSFGFSYDPTKIIHPNVYGSKEAKSALIEFTANGESVSFLWDGRNTHEELGNISIFNNNCVQLSLGDRHLIVSPIGFHLFGLVTDELVALGEMLRKKMTEYPVEISWLPILHFDTPQQRLVAGLSGRTSDDQLKAAAKFTVEHAELLESKKKELAGLNRELLVTQRQGLETQQTELAETQEKVKTAQLLLSKQKIAELRELNEKILALENSTMTGLKEIAEEKGIALYESEAFKVFLRAADGYLKTLDKQDYPVTGDKCLYCQQLLDETARDLLTNYKRLLNDTTQQDKQVLERQRQALISSVKPVDANLVFHQPVFGIGPDGRPIQPDRLAAYNGATGQLKRLFESNQEAQTTETEADFDELWAYLQEERIRIQTAILGIMTTLASIKEKADSIQAVIYELEDRKILSGKLTEVQRFVQNHKVLDVLKSKTGEFSTTFLSRKTSEARDLLVKENFDDTFRRELKDLRKGHLPIKLSFGTEKGKSKLTQRVSSYALNEILSDGEQKAIALAEFLTELQLDPLRAPVIFDDPVNSLDHQIIDEVAKRLIRLSKTRQTIVFTHSILLLNSLLQQRDLDTNKQEGVKFAFWSVQNNYDETGILGNVEEINSFNDYKAKFNGVISRAKAGTDEAKLAAEGYGHLRSAIEVTIEHEVLAKTIIRYRKGVAFPSLLRVKGKLLDEHKGALNDIYEKCCVSIDGHSSPGELHQTPTVAELKADWEAFMKLRSHFT